MDIDEHCNFLLDTFDRNSWSFTYWAWVSGDFRAIKLLQRDYPKAVAGDLISYHYDPDSGSFSMEWDAASIPDAPTVVCIPKGLDGRTVEITPSASYEEGDIDGTPHLFIQTKKTGRHSVIIRNQ